MKRIILLFLIGLLVAPLANAQNSEGKADDLARISLTPIVPDELQTVPKYAKKCFRIS